MSSVKTKRWKEKRTNVHTTEKRVKKKKQNEESRHFWRKIYLSKI